MFNEILILPFLNFDKYTRPALEKSKHAEQRGLLDTQNHVQNETQNYSGLSPHASYDATRNQRNLQNKQSELEGKPLGG